MLMNQKPTLKNIAQTAIQSTSEVLQNQKSSLQGLAVAEVQRRLAMDGRNELQVHAESAAELVWRQFKSPMVLLLVAACGISVVVGEAVDAITIAVIILINAGLGFVQEYRSARALEALRTYVQDHATVRRAGRVAVIPRSGLVSGDIVLLAPGDVVPADIRLVEVRDLLLNESTLTGEALPVKKSSVALASAVSTPERAMNLGLMGTTVVSGTATGVVVATGVRTVFGDIAQLTASTIRHSSFDESIKKFSKFLLYVVGITLTIVFVTRLFTSEGRSTVELLLFSIALAVSVIPEALPTIVTITLSRGALKLAKEKVVVKRLAAIEDLGQIQILCTDKTGTLTQNMLTVKDVFAARPASVLAWARLGFSGGDDAQAQSFISALQATTRVGDPSIRGTIVAELPFDPVRRRSSTIVQLADGKRWIVVRGAPEAVIAQSHRAELASGQTSITEARAELENIVERYGRAGDRTLAVALKPISVQPEYHVRDEAGLTVIGIIAFADPLKPTAIDTLAKAKKLNVAVKVITGDSPIVAETIGRQLGLVQQASDVMTGDQLEQLQGQELETRVQSATVFARISPAQKYRIIEVLQLHASVGFLGEGMNDAPALKLANVAMVVQGAADVAKDASDVVLLEKDLHVIIRGIAMGRSIFVNILKYLRCTMIGNFGNFFGIVAISMVVPYLPLLPIQILLTNLLTDFPLVVVATDRVDAEEVQRPAAIHLRELAFIGITLGLVSTLFDILTFVAFRGFGEDQLRTLWVIVSVLTEIILVLSVRSNRFILKASRPSTLLLTLIILSAATIIALPLIPVTAAAFHFTVPTMPQIGLIALFVLAYFGLTEFFKLQYFRYVHKPHAHNRFLKA
ncbi:MAG: HAD-IC family P-type ATPase [Patescibacteria group bacterium]